MMVILLVALALTNIYDLGKKIVLKEGFEEKEDEDKTDVSDDNKSDEIVSEEKDDDENDVKKDNNDDVDSKTSEKKDEKMPEEFKKALEQMSNPETRKTIEGLKELEPMVDKIKNVVEMLK
jgi:predicted Holliday junction resolvase-like endonuclease